MDSVLHHRGRIGSRTLLITAAVPLTGWAVHAIALHKRLAATRKDPLTGLLRRDAYTARARRILTRHGDSVAVVMVDADHFKAVNDTMGHPAGDAVLAAFGARRSGGDEFAVDWTCPPTAARTAWSSWSGCCTPRSSWTTAAPSTSPPRSALRRLTSTGRTAMSSTDRDVDHALASPLWHRHGAKARPLTAAQQKRTRELLDSAQRKPRTRAA
ncbi:GGDEF domain-containing protein [Streptomyces sp. NPDC049687]|uniref:GGDEF domain-containing protein n=1 Tax=Streptomyces sp. NPDC049687 TaxID=3365596 RepID=UPI0037B72CE9